MRGTCVNNPGSFTCDCTGTGYEGPTCDSGKTGALPTSRKKKASAIHSNFLGIKTKLNKQIVSLSIDRYGVSVFVATTMHFLGNMHFLPGMQI